MVVTPSSRDDVVERGVELLHDERGEPERRLVEQQQPRAAHQRPGHAEHLLLPARQLAGPLVAALGEDREQLEHAVLVGP